MKQLSQLEMSSLLEISPRNYQRLEMGEVAPKIETLHQISQILQIPITSLISFKDINLCDIEQLSSKKERNALQDLNPFQHEDLQFAISLLKKDQLEKAINVKDLSKRANSVVDGLYSCVDDTLAKELGLKNQTFKVDDYLIDAHIIDRWEAVFRLNLKKAIIESTYLFPCGIKVLQGYHYELSPTPDSPKSKCILKDVTYRYELTNWIKNYSLSNDNLSNG